ncbi:MAG: hypothetical protein ACOCXQ_00770 [Patescibacteria group bacterium]
MAKNVSICNNDHNWYGFVLIRWNIGNQSYAAHYVLKEGEILVIGKNCMSNVYMHDPNSLTRMNEIFRPYYDYCHIRLEKILIPQLIISRWPALDPTASDMILDSAQIHYEERYMGEAAGIDLLCILQPTIGAVRQYLNKHADKCMYTGDLLYNTQVRESIELQLDRVFE